MAQVDVAEAARRLNVSVQRIHQRIDDGSLPAERIGHQWVIDSADLRRIAERQHPGRPLSNRMAWALLRRSAGESPSALGLAPSERSRINKRLADIAEAEDPAVILRRLLRDRAERRLYRASPRDLPAMSADVDLVLSGISHPDSGMAAADLVEAYVRAELLDEIVDRYLLDEAEEHSSDPGRRPNVILHVAEQRIGMAWDLLVAADLADHFGAREEEAARQIVSRVLGERS